MSSKIIHYPVSKLNGELLHQVARLHNVEPMASDSFRTERSHYYEIILQIALELACGELVPVPEYLLSASASAEAKPRATRHVTTTGDNVVFLH